MFLFCRPLFGLLRFTFNLVEDCLEKNATRFTVNCTGQLIGSILMRIIVMDRDVMQEVSKIQTLNILLTFYFI